MAKVRNCSKAATASSATSSTWATWQTSTCGSGKTACPGSFNLGTGRAESFQAVADATLAFHKKGSIEYIPFPDKLKGRYQAFTQADLTNLRKAGYDKPFKTVAEGVTEYMAWLNRDA